MHAKVPDDPECDGARPAAFPRLVTSYFQPYKKTATVLTFKTVAARCVGCVLGIQTPTGLART
jgi:hypothetical protein